MTLYHNLVVDLDERFGAAALATHRRLLEGAGFAVWIGQGADDRTLAWIDETFGGTWSGEAYGASNVIVTRGGAPAGFASFDPQQRRFAWLRGLGAQRGVGIFGPFGVDPALRGLVVGPALLALALGTLRDRGYTRGLIAAVAGQRLVDYYGRTVGATVAETFDLDAHAERPVRTVVLASGSGTNFQAVIDATGAGLPLQVNALISNRNGAFAIERARNAAIESIVLPWNRSEQSRESYDRMLLEAVAAREPDLVLLLGWMHLLDRRFVDAFPNMLNVHPAFLPIDPARDDVGMPDGTFIPAFRGAHAVRDALAAGSAWVGASVHGVTSETDRGPVFARKPLPVNGEDEASVLERLHPVEHGLVVTAVRRWLFERER